MTDQSMRDEIEIIQRMIQETRKKVMDSGVYFILWGMLTLVATGAFQISAWRDKLQFMPYIVWAFPVLGIVITLVLKNKREKKEKIVTFVDKVVSATWFACGFGIASLSLVSHLGSDSTGVGSIFLSFVSIIIGIGMIITGAAYRWKVFSSIGILWWLVAVVMQIVPSEYMAVIFCLMIGLAMVVPGIIANILKNRNEK
ncbi:MAG: hypothetical protein KOO63_07015 [Bacteroidales bacterium]|nr:hypothetical protein [Candidatus Latescibacterota bacterium]